MPRLEKMLIFVTSSREVGLYRVGAYETSALVQWITAVCDCNYVYYSLLNQEVLTKAIKKVQGTMFKVSECSPKYSTQVLICSPENVLRSRHRQDVTSRLIFMHCTCIKLQ